MTNSTGAVGPDQEEVDVQRSDQLKDSLAEQVSSFAQDPVQLVGPSTTEASISDFVPKASRKRMAPPSYDDPNLLAVMENMGESPPIFDPEQRAVAFNPILLEAKVSLFNIEQSQDIKLTIDHLEKQKSTGAVGPEQESEQILDLREGALSVEAASGQGSILQLIDSEKL